MKRILALQGGGLRGIVEVAFLEKVEAVYRARRGPQARLADVFDLVGGTSTGALIAAAVALGKPVSDIAAFYLDRAERVFAPNRGWRMGVLPIFDADRLEREIRAEIGDVALGDPAIRTRLAVVAKRLDTGSVWIVSNIPTAPFYDDPADGAWVGNRHFPLARLLRASSAAPTFFRQETLAIVPGQPPGVFVDGGASPYNDPSLALLMLARMRAFGLRWPAGPENLFMLSIGCGRVRRRIAPRKAATAGPLAVAVESLRGMIDDGEQHALTMMEWLGRSRAPQRVNAELGVVGDDDAFDAPMLEYLRLDVPLEPAPLAAAGLFPGEAALKRMQRIDDPRMVRPLYDLTRAWLSHAYDLDALLP